MSEQESARVEVVRLPQHRDERGTAFEPLDPDTLALQRNVHVVLTRPGYVRGNHVHKASTEVLAIQGPARVRYRVRGEDHDVEVPADQPMAFRFPPGVPHAVLNTGRAVTAIVAFRDRPYDPDDPDTEPVTLMEPR